MVRWLPLLLLVVITAPLAAQHPRDDNRGNDSYPYGYAYSPWQQTPWNALEYRTKCEGEPVRGMEVGPIRWVVEIRNRTTELVTFSYAILPRGDNKRPSAKGRAKTKPGATFVKLASLPTTRCDDGMTMLLDSVRVGADK